MIDFRLEEKSRGKVLTCFRVLDQSGSVYGSVNIPNEATADFLAHWKGAAPVATAAKQPSAARRVERSFQASETTAIEQAGDPARFLIDTRAAWPRSARPIARRRSKLDDELLLPPSAKSRSRVPAPTPARNASDIDDKRAWMDFSH